MSRRRILIALLLAAVLAFLFFIARAAGPQLSPSSVHILARVEVAGEHPTVGGANFGIQVGSVFAWGAFKSATPGQQFSFTLWCHAVDCSAYQQGEMIRAVLRGNQAGPLIELVAV